MDEEATLLPNLRAVLRAQVSAALEEWFGTEEGEPADAVMSVVGPALEQILCKTMQQGFDKGREYEKKQADDPRETSDDSPAAGPHPGP